MKTSQIPLRILLPSLLLTLAAAPAQSAADKPPEVTLVQGATGRLPAGFKPSPALEPVVTLAQSGVSEEVLMAYLASAGTRIALTPEEIIFLRDLGLSDAVITLLLGAPPAGDAALAASPAPPVAPMLPATNAAPPPAVAAAAAPPAPANANAEMVVPPADTVTTNQFVDALAPYGNWVKVDGYGLAWQPTVVVINQTWRPYADCGRWVWSNHGWYWSSDYSWGWAPFHYGRWVSHPSYRWVWCPDTQWGPSWVSWRYSSSYCGWAPLPPTAHYRSGVGFSYRSQSVGIHFEFGLGARDYCYVPTPNFCHPRPVTCAVPYDRVHAVHQTTTVANNYIHNEHNVVINRGISPNAVALISKAEVPQVAVTPGRNGSRHGAGRVLPDGTLVTGGRFTRATPGGETVTTATFPPGAPAGSTRNVTGPSRNTAVGGAVVGAPPARGGASSGVSTPPSTPVGSVRAGVPPAVRGEAPAPGNGPTIHTITRGVGPRPQRPATPPSTPPANTAGVQVETAPPVAAAPAGGRGVVQAAPSGSRFVPPSPMVVNGRAPTTDARLSTLSPRPSGTTLFQRPPATAESRPEPARVTPATPQVPQPTLPATGTSPARAPTVDARLSTLSPRASAAPVFQRQAPVEMRTAPATPQVSQPSLPVTSITPRSAPPAFTPPRAPTVDSRLSTLSPRAPTTQQQSLRSTLQSLPRFNGGGQGGAAGLNTPAGGGSRFVPPTPATGR